jgi:hypothetical protein|tara:strand:- start:2461 stop:3417 length:957 start_codon:yes stop_codon:yes gene_type:complete
MPISDHIGGFIRPGFNPLLVTDAPTIGTATKGSTNASVAFTAPADIGGSAIISYTVVSSPGGFIATGAASPLVVTGLTNGTAYTFTVVALNKFGPSSASATSNSVTPARPLIGDAYEGGYFAGQISTTANGVATHDLVVAPLATGQVASTQYSTDNGPTSSGPTSATFLIDGPQNTAIMMSGGTGAPTTYPAGNFCNNLTIGGHSDWYMAAKNELIVQYFFLKPTTTTNSVGYGANVYAVSPEPSNTGYTSGTPAQTSATVFQSGGAEAFSAAQYWSSNQDEINYSYGWTQWFSNGLQNRVNMKTYNRSVRAIRRVAV